MITKLLRNACNFLLPLVGGVILLGSSAAAADSPDAAIRGVLEKQSAAWNRGDVETFVTFYAPDATFVGETVTRGSGQLLERYKKRYPTRGRMGKLTFSDVEVRMLGADNALVIGKWHLERDAASGGPVGGIYSLVFVRSPGGWRILHDHTS
ncbi:MAG: nuclear transport factor 2 family protein [Bryobacteraceae bacterium]